MSVAFADHQKERQNSINATSIPDDEHFNTVAKMAHNPRFCASNLTCFNCSNHH